MAPTDPSATRSPAVVFPGAPVRRRPVLRRFHAGMRRAAPVASRVLVPMPSLPPRRSGPPRQSVCDVPSGLRLHGCRLGLRGSSRAGPPVRSRALRPGDSPPSHGCGCRKASQGWVPVPLLSELQGADGSPGRFSSSCTRQPSLDAPPDMRVSLIRFLGTARFHPARLPDSAGNPRHLSPSALQHPSSPLRRSRAPPRHAPHPCTIVGRGSGYAALIRPHARHVICRPPRRFSQYRHARVAAASTRWRRGLLHRTPSYGEYPRSFAHSQTSCSWGARWRLSRHQRQHAPRVRRSRLPSVFRLMVELPRQVVPQEWTTPRKLKVPGL